MNWPCKSRNNSWRLASVSVVLFVSLAVSATGNGAEAVPDFSLIDVNSTSSTYNQLVSPRDYLQQTSAWYFGVSGT